MTGHGFRGMAATLLNKQGRNADAIKRQLSHAESKKVRDAYAHAAHYLDERVRMMRAWADYLDGLRARKDVAPIRKAGKQLLAGVRLGSPPPAGMASATSTTILCNSL